MFENENTQFQRTCCFQMSADILVIIEFGAQKQRISLNTNDTYNDICDQIYSVFRLDQTKSNYRLQRQDPSKPGSFINIEERSFLHDLKRHAFNRDGNSALRFRIHPLISKKMVNKILMIVILTASRLLSVVCSSSPKQRMDR